MKLNTIAFLSLSLFASAALAKSADCSDTYSYADDAYTQARKGYNATDLEEAEHYAKKAMSAAEDAMTAAEECRCDDAYSAADDAHRYAKNAYQAGNFDDAIDYLRKAKNSAEDAMSYANDCGT